MPYFDSHDICSAYLAIEQEWNMSGWLQERPSNRRRSESTGVQLSRLHFRPGLMFNGYKSLTDNGKEIYKDLCVKYGFDINLATKD